MKISGNEIKTGMLLEHKNDLWEVLKTQHVKPGKGGAFNQVEMKSVNKNTKLNERFRSSETVEKASLDEIKYNFLFEDENNYIFMDPKSFEQIEIKKETISNLKSFKKNSSNQILLEKIGIVMENVEKIDCLAEISDETITKFLTISKLKNELREAVNNEQC